MEIGDVDSKVKFFFFSYDSSLNFNPLTPKSDLHLSSLYDIDMLSSKQVMRKLKLIR